MARLGVEAWALISVVGVIGCAGQPARDVEEAPGAGAQEAAEPVATEIPEPEPAEELDDSAPPAVAEPAFTAGMSVSEARDAVPMGADRLNIEQEALAAPLLSQELYAPCQVASHQHFELEVAIWEGRAVGLDVSATPVDAKLEACLREQIAAVEWPDKVASLNTVQYGQ